MKTLTATQLARNLRCVLDGLEQGGEEIVIVRKNHPVARLVPGAPAMTALEALSDLYGILPDEEGESWLRDSRRPGGTLDEELRDPWE